MAKLYEEYRAANWKQITNFLISFQTRELVFSA